MWLSLCVMFWWVSLEIKSSSLLKIFLLIESKNLVYLQVSLGIRKMCIGMRNKA